jgi:hypothetical protein
MVAAENGLILLLTVAPSSYPEREHDRDHARDEDELDDCAGSPAVSEHSS